MTIESQKFTLTPAKGNYYWDLWPLTSMYSNFKTAKSGAWIGSSKIRCSIKVTGKFVQGRQSKGGGRCKQWWNFLELCWVHSHPHLYCSACTWGNRRQDQDMGGGGTCWLPRKECETLGTIKSQSEVRGEVKKEEKTQEPWKISRAEWSQGLKVLFRLCICKRHPILLCCAVDLIFLFSACS